VLRGITVNYSIYSSLKGGIITGREVKSAIDEIKQ